MDAEDKLLRLQCIDFVTEQSGGEWGDDLIETDAEKLFAFVSERVVERAGRARTTNEFLRDHFAGQALAGDLASQSAETGVWPTETPDNDLVDRARFYYRFADAMLVARSA